MMSDEKKIIIDEDWKSQVEAEKSAAEKPVTPPEQPATTATGQPTDPSDVQFPPASFDLLLTTLATETLVALGQIPHPATGKARVHRHHAQYLIDTIDVLREKTKGNLTPEEQQGIEGLLHQLRMAFIASEGAPAVEGGSEN